MNAASSNKTRVAALDLTKGILVVFMVLYHSLNYTTDYTLAFKFLAFLPPSFIIITGFLIGDYGRTRREGDATGDRRLLMRGLKLLILFTALNVAAKLAVRGNLHGGESNLVQFWTRWPETYVSGDGRLAAFDVLLPIAYLLLTAPIILRLDRLHPLVLPVITIAVLGVCALLEARNALWLNAHFYSAGIVGILLGRISLSRMNVLARFWGAAVGGYAFYFWIGHTFGQNYLLQMTGALLALAAIFGLFANRSADQPLLRGINLLGRYSLVGYIAQIGILQILVRITGRPEPASLDFWILVVATLGLTYFSVWVIEVMRRRSPEVDGAYKAVFA
jgi:hypothetical protein